MLEHTSHIKFPTLPNMYAVQKLEYQKEDLATPLLLGHLWVGKLWTQPCQQSVKVTAK